jgi:hypothetical protein
MTKIFLFQQICSEYSTEILKEFQEQDGYSTISQTLISVSRNCTKEQQV